VPSEWAVEKAREWLDSHCDAFGNVYAGDVDSLAALLEEVDGMARSETLVKCCVCENADAPRPDCECVICTVAKANREREEARAEVERLRAYVGSEMTRSDFRTAADMRAEVERLRGKLQRVRDAIKFAANSDGGLVAEIDDALRGGE
jgi:hypothetical protein